MLIKLNFKKVLEALNIFIKIYEKENKNILIIKKNKKIYFLYLTKNTKIYAFIKKSKKIFKKFLIDLKDFYNSLKNIKNKKLNIYIYNNKIIIYSENNVKNTLIFKKNDNIKILKKINTINYIEIKIKTFFLIKILNLFLNFIDKKEFNKFTLLIKNNYIKFLINNEKTLLSFYFKIKNNNIKRKINLQNSLIILIKNLIKYFNKKTNIIITKNNIVFKLNKYIVISKIKIEKKFLILKNFKKLYKNYIIIKKNVLEKNLKCFLSLNKINNKILKIVIKKNILEINNKINPNKRIKKVINIKYNGEPMCFFIEGNIIYKFLKNILEKDLILNFSKKNNLVITIPSLKGFKYCMKIIKI